MKSVIFSRLVICLASAALPMAAMGTTVIVNGQPDVPGVSYTKLSTAVEYVQQTDPYPGEHVVNVITDEIPAADGEILITTGPLTINGDADGNGVKCDILVDTAAIQPRTYTSVGRAHKAYIEIQASTPITIRDLKIHPNSDGPGPDAAELELLDGVSGIVTHRGDVDTTHTFERVWVSGSDASNNYIPLDTANDLYGIPGVKRWAFAPGAGSNDTTMAAIQISNEVVTSDVNLVLDNCHAGLSRTSALNFTDRSTADKIVRGGVYGHSNRNGIYISGRVVTLTGSPTNRLRIVRVPYEASVNAHAIEIELIDTTVRNIEYVDVATITTGNNIKWGSPTNDGNKNIGPVRYCRFMGHLDTGTNATGFAQGRTVSTIEKCTFIGGALSGAPFLAYRPFETNGNIGGTFANSTMYINDTIFASEYNVAESTSGSLVLNNTDGVGGVRALTNCALPIDGYENESLLDPPVTGTNANVVSIVNPVSVSPHFVKTLADYDWSEAAVSVDGSNPNAGNPDVYRPSNQDYVGKASDTTDLTGGAGGTVAGSAVNDWSIY